MQLILRVPHYQLRICLLLRSRLRRSNACSNSIHILLSYLLMFSYQYVPQYSLGQWNWRHWSNRICAALFTAIQVNQPCMHQMVSIYLTNCPKLYRVQLYSFAPFFCLYLLWRSLCEKQFVRSLKQSVPPLCVTSSAGWEPCFVSIFCMWASFPSGISCLNSFHSKTIFLYLNSMCMYWLQLISCRCPSRY